MAEHLDEVNERRLLKKGFSTAVIRYVGEIVPSQQRGWINTLMKMTPEKVKEINQNMVED